MFKRLNEFFISAKGFKENLKNMISKLKQNPAKLVYKIKRRAKKVYDMVFYTF